LTQEYGFGVADFDMKNYPEVDSEGSIMTSVFRIEYKGKNGQLYWLKSRIKGDENNGKHIPHGLMISSGNRAIRWAEPPWQDIVNSEREIFQRTEGKGEVIGCSLGLWFYQESKDDIEKNAWKETDWKTHPSPEHWLDVSEKYFGEWRKRAFEGRTQMDPWKPVLTTGGVKGLNLQNRKAQLDADQKAAEEMRKNKEEAVEKELAELRDMMKQMIDSKKAEK